MSAREAAGATREGVPQSSPSLHGWGGSGGGPQLAPVMDWGGNGGVTVATPSFPPTHHTMGAEAPLLRWFCKT